MPVIKSEYKAPLFLRNGHLSTILPSLFRKVEGVTYERERITTPDNDFLDLDWIRNANNRVVIVLHGLEGSSDRHYSKGVAKQFSANGWDVVAWNARSCSGEINTQPRLYHHADIKDIYTTITHVLNIQPYTQMALVGFSMGGAVVLNYLSKSTQIPPQIKVAVAISAPVDVGDSAKELEHPNQSFYLNRFIKKLKKKIEVKARMHPNVIDATDLEQVRTFSEFDTRFTAPLHGFANANDFYLHASAKSELCNLTIPTLLLIADNDPFMPDSCYPYEEAEASNNLYLEVPKHGGHVGFGPSAKDGSFWSERRAFEFIKGFI